jgi:hypothetical protein
VLLMAAAKELEDTLSGALDVSVNAGFPWCDWEFTGPTATTTYDTFVLKVCSAPCFLQRVNGSGCGDDLLMGCVRTLTVFTPRSHVDPEHARTYRPHAARKADDHDC